MFVIKLYNFKIAKQRNTRVVEEADNMSEIHSGVFPLGSGSGKEAW